MSELNESFLENLKKQKIILFGSNQMNSVLLGLWKVIKMKKICIGKKFIGEGYPCFTIAEAGANHEGDIKKAFQLIDEAKNSGVDAIKFQTYTAAKLTTKTAPKYWDDGIKNESQFDVFSKLDKLSDNEWKEVFDYAKIKK